MKWKYTSAQGNRYEIAMSDHKWTVEAEEQEYDNMAVVYAEDLNYIAGLHGPSEGDYLTFTLSEFIAGWGGEIASGVPAPEPVNKDVVY